MINSGYGAMGGFDNFTDIAGLGSVFQSYMTGGAKKKRLKKNTKKTNILSLILVFIISMIALIVIVDTFKSPISIIIPNIEYILYNLFESIKDIILFIKDLN